MRSIIESKNAKLLTLNIKDLEYSPKNTYDATENIEELKASIRIGGLATPLLALKVGDKYQILSGNRRFTALNQLIEETGDTVYENVPVYCIEQNLSSAEQIYLIETTNLEQRDKFDRNQHVMTMIGSLKQMADDPEIPDITDENITKILQKSINSTPRYAQMYMAISKNATEELTDLVVKNEVPVHIAAQVSSYDKNTQNKVADAIKKGAKPTNVIENLREVKAEVEKKKKENQEKKAKKTLKPTENAKSFFTSEETVVEDDSDFDMEKVMNELLTPERLIAEPKNNVNVDSVGKISQHLKEEENSANKVNIAKANQASSYIKSLIGSKEMTDSDLELYEACKNFVKYYESNKADISVISTEEADYDDDTQSDYTIDYNDSDNVNSDSDDDF